MARVRYSRGAANSLSGAWGAKRTDFRTTPSLPPKKPYLKIVLLARAATARGPRSTSLAPSVFLPVGYFQCESRLVPAKATRGRNMCQQEKVRVPTP